jgi:hypothetical protein
MAASAERGGGLRRHRWRIAAWTGAALTLLLPLVAMQFTDEVNWSETDFIVAGALIGGTGLTFELAARATANHAYRAAVGLALAAAFLLIWLNLAVGIIGTEDNPLNLIFGAVLATGIIGAVIVRCRPFVMARAMLATALAQLLVVVIALTAGLGFTAPIWPLTGCFAALWLGSAWLFRKSAREQTPASPAPKVITSPRHHLSATRLSAARHRPAAASGSRPGARTSSRDTRPAGG